MDTIIRHTRKISTAEPTGKALACMSTIELILTNILKEPTNVIFQKISTRSNTWKTKIADVEGAVDLLAEIGFRVAVVEFEEFYILRNIDPLALKNALDIVQERKNYCIQRDLQAKARKEVNAKEEEEYIKQVKSMVEDDQKTREERWTKK